MLQALNKDPKATKAIPAAIATPGAKDLKAICIFFNVIPIPIANLPNCIAILPIVPKITFDNLPAKLPPPVIALPNAAPIPDAKFCKPPL